MDIVFERTIAATPDTVWEVITDFASYGDWNPFVTACQAELIPGADIAMQVCLGGRVRRQVETVAEVEVGRRFVYRMKPIPLLLNSQREHCLAANREGGTLYRSTFVLRGWAAPVVGLLLGGQLRQGFESMSNGIQQRAEALRDRD